MDGRAGTVFLWAAFMYMWTYTNGAIAATVWGTTDVQSAGYQEAGNWVGVLFAVQAIGSVIWAVILPLFKARKQAYALSLVLGGIGFISTLFFHNEYLLFISYLLIGCAWAAMLAMPFTILPIRFRAKTWGLTWDCSTEPSVYRKSPPPLSEEDCSTSSGGIR